MLKKHFSFYFYDKKTVEFILYARLNGIRTVYPVFESVVLLLTKW